MKLGEIFKDGSRTYKVVGFDTHNRPISAVQGTDVHASDAITMPDERDNLKVEIRAEIMRELAAQGMIQPPVNPASAESSIGSQRTACQYCGRECKGGLVAHENACKEEPTKKAALIEQAKALGIETDGKSGEELSKDIKVKK